MNIGDNIVLTETVMVFDDLGHDFLIVGTEGTVTGIEGSLISVQTAKGVYDGIPAVSARIRTEEKAA